MIHDYTGVWLPRRSREHTYRVTASYLLLLETCYWLVRFLSLKIIYKNGLRIRIENAPTVCWHQAADLSAHVWICVQGIWNHALDVHVFCARWEPHRMVGSCVCVYLHIYHYILYYINHWYYYYDIIIVKSP